MMMHDSVWSLRIDRTETYYDSVQSCHLVDHEHARGSSPHNSSILMCGRLLSGRLVLDFGISLKPQDGIFCYRSVDSLEMQL